MEALLAGGCTESELANIAAGGGTESLARFYYWLAVLGRNRLIQYDWTVDCVVHATLQPTRDDFSQEARPAPDHRLTLSRFAYAYRDGQHLTLACPDAPCRITLRTAAAVGWLGDISSGAELKGDAHAFATMLYGLKFLVAEPTDESPNSMFWEFHDRLFHAMSRQGLGATPAGGTYRFRHKCESPPAIKPPMSDKRITLPVPGLDGLRKQDSLLAVVEGRRSSRDCDDSRPITLNQLGSFLHHVARVKQVIHAPEQDLLARPFPSGGALYELEFYIAVRCCKGLNQGLYQYDGLDHVLYAISSSESQVHSLLTNAAAAMQRPRQPPQCLVILASRLPRLSWKYEGIAYRTSLLNAGVAIQTMYLVATLLELSCCAVGNGDSGTFAQATGLDPLSETSVAEFALSGPG